MRYNVAQLMKEPVGTTRAYEVLEEVSGLEGEWGPLTLSGMVHLLRTNRSILVSASLVTAIPEACSRCLEDFQEPLKLEIEEEFFPRVEVSTGLPLEIPQEAGAFTISERHLLDLLEAVRQAILLARSLQPLCRQDCPGLCPECGHRLGQGPCQCLGQRGDPRWMPLRQLLG